MDDAPLILIIDDDDAIREFVAAVIEKMGYRTMAVADGEEALNYLESSPHPDLILLDVIMPGINGIDLLRMIKEKPSLAEIIVIMVTGVQHIVEKELAFKLGANDYLVKPFDPRELVARIKTHINLKKATERCILQKKIQDTILSTVPGIVYLKDLNGRYLHGNERFAEITRVSVDEIEGKTDDDLFSPRDARQRMRTDELILKMGVPELEMEEDLGSENGSKRTFLTRKSQVLNERNEISGLVGVSIDTTEQAILKEAYGEKDELLMTLIDSFPADIWIVNQDQEIVLQNTRHMMRYGTLIGLSAKSLPPDGEKSMTWTEIITESLRGKISVWKYDQNVDGEPVRVIECTGPIRSSGEIFGAIGFRCTIPCLDVDTADTETFTRFIQAILSNNDKN